MFLPSKTSLPIVGTSLEYHPQSYTPLFLRAKELFLWEKTLFEWCWLFKKWQRRGKTPYMKQKRAGWFALTFASCDELQKVQIYPFYFCSRSHTICQCCHSLTAACCLPHFFSPPCPSDAQQASDEILWTLLHFSTQQHAKSEIWKLEMFFKDLAMCSKQDDPI